MTNHSFPYNCLQYRSLHSSHMMLSLIGKPSHIALLKMCTSNMSRFVCFHNPFTHVQSNTQYLTKVEIVEVSHDSIYKYGFFRFHMDLSYPPSSPYFSCCDDNLIVLLRFCICISIHHVCFFEHVRRSKIQ